MKNLLYNEGYKNNFRVKKAKNQYIFTSRNKKLIDLSMCSGTLILGHSSKIYSEAINKQIKEGSAYGLPNEKAEYFSRMLKKIFPKYSKFVMCNSGAEANIRALRVARAITKKNSIAMVSGSWHGSLDQLLFDNITINEKIKLSPLSNGLATNYSKNVIVLPYNNYELTKKILKKNKNKIALVIIEPIQQYIPNELSEIYIKKILNFCKKNEILICFDEMITGMRIREFSVQQKLNLSPDISTFGKIIGGGLPIGVVAINKKIENKLKKINPRVFFGGTFSGNPLTSHVGAQTIKFILKNKKKFYLKIEKLSKFFENNLNSFFIKNNIKFKVYNYHSMLRIIFSNEQIYNRTDRDLSESKLNKKIEKFKKYVIQNGVYHPDRGAYFISYCHSKKDIKYICKVFIKGMRKYFLD